MCLIALLFISLEDLKLKGPDLAFNRWLHRVSPIKPFSSLLSDETRRHWLGILEKILLGLSDTQLLTGIAILTAGYVKCSISVYHSNIVADLAWFASGTHLSSLSILKHYLCEHPATKWLRVFLLLVALGLLLSVALYQGKADWYDSDIIPAQCLFAEGLGNIGGYPAFWMGLNIIFVVLGYGGSIADLFPEHIHASSAIIRGYIRIMEKTRDVIKTCLRNIHSQLGKSIVMAGAVIGLSALALAVLSITWTIMYLFYLLMDSYLVIFIFEIFWFVYGLINLNSDMKYGQSWMSLDDMVVERQWGFGQFVPMFLLLLPMMNAWETWYGRYSLDFCKSNC